MSAIKAITVVCQQGTKQYAIGQVVNGMEISLIKDETTEYPDALHSAYSGRTSCDEVVFRLENAPVDVEYYMQPETEATNES